jgi:hypothetical protein
MFMSDKVTRSEQEQNGFVFVECGAASLSDWCPTIPEAWWSYLQASKCPSFDTVGLEHVTTTTLYAKRPAPVSRSPGATSQNNKDLNCTAAESQNTRKKDFVCILLFLP